MNNSEVGQVSPWHGTFSGCSWRTLPPDMQCRYEYSE